MLDWETQPFWSGAGLFNLSPYIILVVWCVCLDGNNNLAGVGFVIAELVSLSGQFWCWNLEIWRFSLKCPDCFLSSFWSRRLLSLNVYYFWPTFGILMKLKFFLFFTASIWSLQPGPTLVLGVFFWSRRLPWKQSWPMFFGRFFYFFTSSVWSRKSGSTLVSGVYYYYTPLHSKLHQCKMRAEGSMEFAFFHTSLSAIT